MHISWILDTNSTTTTSNRRNWVSFSLVNSGYDVSFSFVNSGYDFKFAVANNGSTWTRSSIRQESTKDEQNQLENNNISKIEFIYIILYQSILHLLWKLKPYW